MTDKPIAPRGINHLVLNVRDIEEAHRFWTEVIGFQQVGELKEAPGRPNPPKMRFYSSGGHHHDLALVENPNLPPPPAEWAMFGMPSAINHIAITYPSREAWLSQLSYLQSRGVKFNRRVEHGMTHSLYINDPNGYGVELVYDLPRETWEGDLDAALNYAEILPTEGADALIDRVDVPMFRAASAAGE
jgi:catechol-2,3-dioxygenase